MIRKVFPIAMIVAVVLNFHYTSALAAEGIGQVTSLKGEAWVVRTGEKEKTALGLNDLVYLGDTIQTAAESKIQILMEDDSLLNLGEKSRITIKEHLYQPEKDLRDALYKLIRGKVRVVVGKLFSDPASRLEVETPTSIIGIRMTEFIVWVVSPELTIVITIDGEVIAKNIRPDLVCRETVKEGYQSQIAKDACPTAPGKTPTEKMEEILLETEAYMPPPAQEMPSSMKSLKESVKKVLATAPAAILLAPVTGILGTGMMGAITPLAGGIVLSPLTAEATNIQFHVIQPGEVSSTFILPVVPSPPPIPPIPPLPLMLPEPPPPPH